MREGLFAGLGTPGAVPEKDRIPGGFFVWERKLRWVAYLFLGFRENFR